MPPDPPRELPPMAATPPPKPKILDRTLTLSLSLTHTHTHRAVVRRHELLQKELEKARQVLTAKMEAKEMLVKEVHNSMSHTLAAITLYHILH